MKKLIIAILMMASLGVNAANTSYIGIYVDLKNLYTDLGGDVATDYTGAGEVFGNGGAIQQVTRGADDFVEAFRGASTEEGFRVTFDANEWTVNSGDTDFAVLEAARSSLKTSEAALLTQITEDLVGDGSVANSWGSAEIAQARVRGGLVGNLSANIQESVKAISDATATTDVQTVYETDGSLDSFFESTNAEVAALQLEVNETREAVATTRDGFSDTGAAIGGNTSQIIADAGDSSLTGLVYTNATGDHIQLSDYFLMASALVDSDSNELLEEIVKDKFYENSGVYSSGIYDYPSFTDFVLERSGIEVREEATFFQGGGTFVPIANMGIAAQGEDTMTVSRDIVPGTVYLFDIFESGTSWKVRRQGTGTYSNLFSSPQDAVNWIEVKPF